MAVFWVVVRFSLVEVYRRFRGACCFHNQGDDEPDDGGRNTYETLNFDQTTRRNILEDSHLLSFLCILPNAYHFVQSAKRKQS
jgi:hypothetical protein